MRLNTRILDILRQQPVGETVTLSGWLRTRLRAGSATCMMRSPTETGFPAHSSGLLMIATPDRGAVMSRFFALNSAMANLACSWRMRLASSGTTARWRGS